jgi:putative DNA primase/helicase
MNELLEAAPVRTVPMLVTEDSLAAAFARECAGLVRYDHHSGRWFIWNGQRWRKDETQRVLEGCRGLCRSYAALDPSNGKTLGKVSTITGIERLARADPQLAVTGDVFDQDPLLLGTPGGTIDLKTGAIRTPDPSDHITKAAAVAPAPAGSRPERWLRFLQEAAGGDAELVCFLQVVAGYCLTGLTDEHALFFVYGPGGNGKSVFLNTLSGILGDYAATAPMETFTASLGDRHPTDLAMLRGARLVSASETEEGRAWAESRIKQLTGGDLITARFMRQDYFTYKPMFKLLIIGNHKPALRNIDDAARRRFRLIPFTVKPAVPDPKLEEGLREEWPAILRWMIDGCVVWQTGRLPRPTVVERETAGYFADQDILRQWLEECCDIDWPPINPASQTRCLSSKLFSSWQQWCQRNGETTGTNKRLSQDLERRGFIKKATKSGKDFVGLTVRPQSYETA